MFPDLNEEDAGIIKLKIAAGYAEEFDDYTKGNLKRELRLYAGFFHRIFLYGFLS